MLTLSTFLISLTGSAQTGGSTCDDIVYYLSDHDAEVGISSIYQVTLNGTEATMEYVATSDIEVHIAYNPVDNMLYAISKHENSYRILDPILKTWGSEVSLGDDYGEITAAVFNHDGKLLIGSQDHKVIYSVNVVTNAVSTYDTYAPVYGGDLAFASDGMLYMATRSGNGLYEVYSEPMLDNIIGTLPAKVTGMAITDTDQLLISAQGQTSLKVYNLDGSVASSEYDLVLNDEIYTLHDGDMASGCNTRPPFIGYCSDFTTFYVNHGPDIDGSNLYKVNFTSSGVANLTFLTNVPYEAHIAFNATDNLVYLVNVDGSFIRIYDVTLNSFLTDLPIIGSFTKLTATLYNPNNGLLYIGDHNADKIYTVNLTSGMTTYYADGSVSGGDLEMLDNGDIYLATREGAGLYKIKEGGSAEFVGNIPPTVNGMARANDNVNSFMLANKDATVFTQVSPIDGSTIATFPIMLDGSPFTTMDGDMAAGCADSNPYIEGCANYKLYYTHRPVVDGPASLLKVTLNSNGTASYTTELPDFGGAIGITPDGNTLYAGVGNQLITIDVSSAASITSSQTITDAVGTELTPFPGLVVSHDGTIYAACNTTHQVYTIDPNTGVATPFGPSRYVSGADLVELDNEIWLITRSNNTFTNVLSGASFTVPVNQIAGAAVLGNGNILLADGDGIGESLLKVVDPTTHAVIKTYDIGLPLFNGDFAGVCVSNNDGVTPPENPFTSIESTTSSTLTSYPNPTKGPSKVVFATGETTNALIEVYDMSGRNVATIFNAEVQKDQEYLINFDGSNLSRGVYIYRLTTSHETIIEKFMITR